MSRIPRPNCSSPAATNDRVVTRRGERLSIAGSLMAQGRAAVRLAVLLGAFSVPATLGEALRAVARGL